LLTNIFFFIQTIGNEMNQSKTDEEETSELIELAKIVNIFLTMNTDTQTKKSQLVRLDLNSIY
jgi:hypothetical protein